MGSEDCKRSDRTPAPRSTSVAQRLRATPTRLASKAPGDPEHLSCNAFVAFQDIDSDSLNIWHIQARERRTGEFNRCFGSATPCASGNIFVSPDRLVK